MRSDSIILCDEILPDCGLEGYMKLIEKKSFQKAQNALIVGQGVIDFILPPFMLEDFKK